MAVGWMSPALPQLLAPDGILSRLPAEEAFILSSWLAAIFPIGAFCMTPFAAYFVDHFGKKKAGILTGIPFMVCLFSFIVFKIRRFFGLFFSTYFDKKYTLQCNAYK